MAQIAGADAGARRDRHSDAETSQKNGDFLFVVFFLPGDEFYQACAEAVEPEPAASGYDHHAFFPAECHSILEYLLHAPALQPFVVFSFFNLS